MSLQFHHHPLSSYCWKVAIALDERDVAFEPVAVNLGDPTERGSYLAISPFGKIPALRDTTTGQCVYETSVMIEYLDQRFPGATPLIPADPAAALQVRLRDRLFDQYVHGLVQRVVSDRLRPPDKRDAFTVDQAHADLRRTYEVLEGLTAPAGWAVGEAFSMADCAAAPALFYADLMEPIGAGRPRLAAYYARLRERPSVRRVIEAAKPFFQYYPATPEERARLAAQGLG